MIVYADNVLLVLPVILLIWALDAYLFAVALRSTAGCVPTVRRSEWFNCLEGITDVLPRCISRRLSERWTSSSAPWISWLIVIVGAVVIRQILAWSLIGLS